MTQNNPSICSRLWQMNYVVSPPTVCVMFAWWEIISFLVGAEYLLNSGGSVSLWFRGSSSVPREFELCVRTEESWPLSWAAKSRWAGRSLGRLFWPLARKCIELWSWHQVCMSVCVCPLQWSSVGEPSMQGRNILKLVIWTSQPSNLASRLIVADPVHAPECTATTPDHITSDQTTITGSHCLISLKCPV